MERMAFLILLVCCGAAAADARIDRARAEGGVTWYTAMNVPDAEAVKKVFLQRYPFLDVAMVRATGEKVRTRILTEARGNRFTWDVVSFNLLDMDALNREGLLAVYASPEAKSGYPAGAVDPDGRWAAIYVRQYVIGYNTKLVPAAAAPKTWDELLAPRWAGKLAIDESDVEWYAAMLDYLGRDKGTSFMRALSGQKPQQRRGHHLLTRLLVAGEFPLALVHANEVDKERLDGAPVDWVRSLDPVITSPSQVGISAKAPRPVSARLFVDFLLSKEGQRTIQRSGRVPARTDLGDGAGGDALKVHYVHPRLAAQFNQHEKDFRQTFARAP